MNSTTYSHKPVEKVTSDDGSLSFDLLGQLTHMSILSLAGVPRDWIFRSSGDMALGTGTFFLHVYRLVKSAGMEYSQALKLVAGITRAPSVKSLFLRFSAASSGVISPLSSSFLSCAKRSSSVSAFVGCLAFVGVETEEGCSGAVFSMFTYIKQLLIVSPLLLASSTYFLFFERVSHFGGLIFASTAKKQMLSSERDFNPLPPVDPHRPATVTGPFQTTYPFIA